jgi:hypothetical protein
VGTILDETRHTDYCFSRALLTGYVTSSLHCNNKHSLGYRSLSQAMTIREAIGNLKCQGRFDSTIASCKGKPFEKYRESCRDRRYCLQDSREWRVGRGQFLTQSCSYEHVRSTGSAVTELREPLHGGMCLETRQRHWLFAPGYNWSYISHRLVPCKMKQTSLFLRPLNGE